MPVIAAVWGHCLGGGLQIALGADLRIVHPDAKLSVLEIRWGLSPDMTGTATLPRLVGIDVAKELTWTGRNVSGAEAVALGLCTRASDDPLADALALATEIAGKSPQAIRGTKALLEQAGPRPAGPAVRGRAPHHRLAHRHAQPGRGGGGVLREALAVVRRPGLTTPGAVARVARPARVRRSRPSRPAVAVELGPPHAGGVVVGVAPVLDRGGPQVAGGERRDLVGRQRPGRAFGGALPWRADATTSRVPPGATVDATARVAGGCSSGGSDCTVRLSYTRSKAPAHAAGRSSRSAAT